MSALPGECNSSSPPHPSSAPCHSSAGWNPVPALSAAHQVPYITPPSARNDPALLSSLFPSVTFAAKSNQNHPATLPALGRRLSKPTTSRTTRLKGRLRQVLPSLPTGSGIVVWTNRPSQRLPEWLAYGCKSREVNYTAYQQPVTYRGCRARLTSRAASCSFRARRLYACGIYLFPVLEASFCALQSLSYWHYDKPLTRFQSSTNIAL